MKQRIQLSDHFTYGRLLRFTLPSIGMMIFTSIYSVVDGFFISNFAGKTPFAAINLIYPFLMILSTVGFMFGTGGSAIVAKTLGEGDRDKGNEYFPCLYMLRRRLALCSRRLASRSYAQLRRCLARKGKCLKTRCSMPA